MLNWKNITLDEKFGWNKLIQSSQTATFFQQYQWLKIWVEHFPTKHEIIGVFDGNELIGIAPISYDQEKVFLMGTTPVLEKEQVCDFGDIICYPNREKEIWTSILDYLSKKYAGKTFCPNFIRENSPSFNILKSLTKNLHSMETSPYLDLPKSWDDYLSRLKRKDRHELRRKLRKLEQVNYRVYQAEPDKINQQKFLKLMKNSTLEKETFLSQPMENFFSDFMTKLNKKQIILWFMDIEDKTVASALAFQFNNELLLYNSGVDLDYKQFSVGILSKALLIKHSIGLGLKKFDFLQGDERYKYNLGGVDNKLYQFIIDL